MIFAKSAKRAKRFKAAQPAESYENLINPGRGFYKLFYVDIGSTDISRFDWVDISGVSLVLLLIDIASCNDRALADTDMDAIRAVLEYFIVKGKRLILRFTYDHDGRGMMREPDRIGMVLEHAKALTGLIKDFKSRVFVYQGLLVGDWGEMHSTRYADNSFLEKIYDVFSGAGVDIAVRKPSQQEVLPVRDGVRPILFNDGILADETELGTVRTDRVLQDERTIYDVSASSPYGGEMVYGSGYIRRQKPDDIRDMLKKRHITYLNIDYDTAVYSFLKTVNVSDDGKKNDAFQYLSVNMGYRFVIKKAVYKKKSLYVYVANKGFSKAYVSVCMRVVTKNGEKLSSDAHIISDIEPGGTECFVFTAGEGQTGDVYVCAETKDSGERVFFSNLCDEKGYVFIGELL